MKSASQFQLGATQDPRFEPMSDQGDSRRRRARVGSGGSQEGSGSEVEDQPREASSPKESDIEPVRANIVFLFTYISKYEFNLSIRFIETKY